MAARKRNVRKASPRKSAGRRRKSRKNHAPLYFLFFLLLAGAGGIGFYFYRWGIHSPAAVNGSDVEETAIHEKAKRLEDKYPEAEVFSLSEPKSPVKKKE